ncbi:MAG: glycosyltransferase family 2 protein [Asgard group archaeon]|nr:glycosyltransferase family 2 protein [Asgard group archaeon]
MITAVQIFLITGGGAYLILVFFALFYLLGTTSGKKGVMPKRPVADDYEQPFVSIIIPTYNEESNIALCLQSLKELNYSRYEIIVSDGGSTDRTVEMAKSFVDKVIIDKIVPPGWVGKNWGCHLGYKEAKGDYLLFVDADTEHTPESLKHFIKVAMERNAALVSVFPFQRIKSWWESINPVFYFASNLTYGGRNSVNNPNKLKNYTASGQYMLFNRKDYEKFGGHEALKGSIVEDLALARVVKTRLRRLFFIDGTKLVYTRMYPDSPKQCWNGTGALLWFLWGMFAPVALSLAIRFYLLNPVGLHWLYILFAAILYVVCGSSVFIYWNKKGAHQWVTYTFYPIVFFMFCFLLGYSALELVITKKTTWRGRVYEPDLFVGTRYQNGEQIVDDNGRLAQLETDIEIELNDQISTEMK